MRVGFASLVTARGEHRPDLPYIDRRPEPCRPPGRIGAIIADKNLPDGSVSRRTFIVLFALVVLALLVLAAFQVSSGLAAHNIGAAGPAGPAGPPGQTGAAATPAPIATRTPTPSATGATGPRGPAGPPGAAAPVPVSMDGGTYALTIADLENSIIELPTSNISGSSSTISSQYLAGTAALFDAHGNKVGTFSATFLSMQTPNGITTSIENHLATDAGLIVTWSTTAAPGNLQVTSVLDAVATGTIVTVTTKSGSSAFFGHDFDLVVSVNTAEISFRFGPVG